MFKIGDKVQITRGYRKGQTGKVTYVQGEGHAYQVSTGDRGGPNLKATSLKLIENA